MISSDTIITSPTQYMFDNRTITLTTEQRAYWIKTEHCGAAVQDAYLRKLWKLGESGEVAKEKAGTDDASRDAIEQPTVGGVGDMEEIRASTKAVPVR